MGWGDPATPSAEPSRCSKCGRVIPFGEGAWAMVGVEGSHCMNCGPISDPRERGPVIHGQGASGPATGLHHLGWDEHSKRSTDPHVKRALDDLREDGDTTKGEW